MARSIRCDLVNLDLNFKWIEVSDLEIRPSMLRIQKSISELGERHRLQSDRACKGWEILGNYRLRLKNL
jgi:hypothetical protein